MLRTDHQALTTLLTSKGIGRAGLRIARWSAQLLCFTYGVTYCPGKQNVTADCLSRLPLPTTGDAAEGPDMVATVFMESLCAMSVSEFTTACETCAEIIQLRHQIKKGWPTCWKNVTNELAPYFHVRGELAVDNSLVMRGTDCLVDPEW